MRFAISTAWLPHEELVPIARAADELGYHAIALPDHVVDLEEIGTPYPYTRDGSRRWANDAEWPDPWVTVGHLAAVTERIRFFTSVYVAALRSPFQVAKSVGTAAVLSGNRVTLGVGIGWCREEGVVDFDGDLWRVPRLTMEPTPSERVPIYVGGISEVGFARAARYDGWVGDLCTIEQGAGWAAALRAKRAEIGASGDFDVVVALTDAVTVEDFRRAGELGMTDTMTAPWAYYSGLDATLEEKLDGMARFAKDVMQPLADGAV